LENPEKTRKKVEKNSGKPGKKLWKNPEKVEKTAEGIVLDDLGLTNVCCRRHMLTHVDIE
jgi:DNA-directed RNA polymerase I, II, and III subunit RPABC5